MSVKPLRKRLYKDTQVGELARDTDDALASLVTFQKRVVVGKAPTTETPIYLQLDAEPFAILCVRCTRVDAPLTAQNLTMVTFDWDQTNRRAKITNIQGAVAAATSYKYSLLVVE